MNLSNIDPAAISQALDDYDPDREHFLDLTDGSIWTFVFSESTDETRKKYDEVRLRIGNTHQRIPSMTTQEAYEEIEDFVENLRNVDVQDSLFLALEKKHAFRNFREAILQHAEERQMWMTYRKERSTGRRERFVASLGGAPAGDLSG